MAIINTTSLATATQNDINALTSSCSFDAFTLLASTITSNDNISSTVANTSVLPDLSTTCMEGTIVFISCLGVPVIATNKKWMGLDGRTLRQDCCDTTLWAWGTSIGVPDASGSARCSPVREICSATNWCNISGGKSNQNGAAVKSNNTLWAWGVNSYGQIGDGTTTQKSCPVREISSSTNWCFVSSRVFGTTGIKTDGSLWSWGRGNNGVLADGTTVSKCSPVREVSSSTNWTRVCGYSHVLALKTDGSLWAWGPGGNGILGDGTTAAKCSPVREKCSATDWCNISAGACHSLALKTGGSLWVWGYGTYGRLGTGNSTSICSPVREICSATDWCGIGAGTQNSAAIKTDGSLWTWGSGSAGALGDGTIVSKCSPIREICSATNWCRLGAGVQLVGALKTDGSLWTWGCNYQGVLGTGNTTNICSPVREVSSSSDWSDLSVGRSVMLGIRRF